MRLPCSSCFLHFFLLVILCCIDESLSASFGCDRNQALKCVQSKELRFDQRTHYRSVVQNTTAADDLCRALQEALTCLDGYVERCGADQNASAFQELMNATRHMSNSICQAYPGYSFHMQCFEKYSVQLLQICNEPLQYQLEIARTRSTDNGLLIVCNAFKDFKKCSSGFLTRHCGKETAKFVEGKIFDPLRNVEELKQCEETSQMTFDGYIVNKCSAKETKKILNDCYKPLLQAIERDGRSSNRGDNAVCRSFNWFKSCVYGKLRYKCKSNDPQVFRRMTNQVASRHSAITSCKSYLYSSSSPLHTFSTVFVAGLAMSSLLVIR